MQANRISTMALALLALPPPRPAAAASAAAPALEGVYESYTTSTWPLQNEIFSTSLELMRVDITAKLYCVTSRGPPWNMKRAKPFCMVTRHVRGPAGTAAGADRMFAGEGARAGDRSIWRKSSAVLTATKWLSKHGLPA